jgi:hypothetical protein
MDSLIHGRRRSLVLESLERRRLLAVLTQSALSLESARDQIAGEFSSATIITHGFQLDGAGDSLMSLASAIVERNGGLLLDFDVSTDGGPGSFDIFQSENRTGRELVLLFDWGDASNNDSDGWGEAAGDALWSIGVALGLFDLDAGAAGSTSLHFIGHSFGTAVTSEVVERLAAFNVPVDHLTYLDPHDFDQSRLPIDGSQDLHTLGTPQTGGDAGYGATVWNNVDFADVYYQTNPLGFFSTNPGGRPIPGAYNVSLTAETSDAGFPHSAVWNEFYISTVTDLNSTTGYAFSSRNPNQPERPQPRFFGGDQDHDHTPPAIADVNSGQPNAAGLANAGLTVAEITTGRWAPQWTPDVVNGGFDFVGNRGDEIPGWTFHGGGGNAELNSNADASLRLLNNNSARTHNWTYFPKDTAFLDYELKLPQGNTAAKLDVLIGETLVETLALDQLSTLERSLAAGNGLPRSLTISDHAGTVNNLTFRLSDSSTTSIGVGIDDVRFDNDDRLPSQPQILISPLTVQTHAIAGNDQPTAILFRAINDTTVGGTLIESSSAEQNVFIVDAQLRPVGNWISDVVYADLSAGSVYAMLVLPTSVPRTLAIESISVNDNLSPIVPTNVFEPTDVSGDGRTSEIDALRIINYLNAETFGNDLPPKLFLDVNGDTLITAVDALVVINHLNARGNTASEPLADVLNVASMLDLTERSHHGLQISNAIAGQGLGTGRVIEDFDTDPTLVADVAQRLHDRHKIDVTHTRAESVGIVGVEVDHAISVLADDAVDGCGLGAHRFDI